MVDLETAIADWRKQMITAGIQSPVPLDELEMHLREEIERQMKSGLSEPIAFGRSVKQVGQPQSLKSEFKKIETNIMKHIFTISAGVLAVLAGMAFVMPAVAQYRQTGAMSNDEPWLFLVGSLLTLGGVGAAWAGARKRIV